MNLADNVMLLTFNLEEVALLILRKPRSWLSFQVFPRRKRFQEIGLALLTKKVLPFKFMIPRVRKAGHQCCRLETYCSQRVALGHTGTVNMCNR